MKIFFTIFLRRKPRWVATSATRVRFPGWTAVWFLAMLGFVGIFFAGLCGRLAADDLVTNQTSLGQVKDFFVPDYYDPPNQNQMKSLLRGAEAQPQPDARVFIKEVQLETYRLDGKVEMVVHTPECTYDQAAQTASSTNHIEARSGDGKLFIEGEGFHWDQTNSIFSISNHVHTIIRSEEPEKPAVP